MAKSSNCDENNDVGYQPSVSSLEQNDTSVTVTPVSSTMSGDSSAYSRTYSETSAFSEPTTDDNSSFGEPSPSPFCWPVLKSGAHKQPILSRLGMKQHKKVSSDELDDPDALNLGTKFPICCKIV